MLFSVIIIAHKISKSLLCSCLQSIEQQSFQDFECLLICDDSSADGLPLFKKVKIEHVDICEIGVKRNYGIQRAKGEYVVFVDSDDLLAQNCLLILSQTIQTIRPDFIAFGSTTDYSAFDNLSIPKTPTVISAQEMQKHILEASFSVQNPLGRNNCFTGAVWGKAFQTKILLKYNIKVPVFDYYFEDGVFVTDYVLHCSEKCVVLDDYIGYYWRPNMSSVIHAGGKPLANFDLFFDASVAMFLRNGWSDQQIIEVKNVMAHRLLVLIYPALIHQYEGKLKLNVTRSFVSNVGKTKTLRSMTKDLSQNKFEKFIYFFLKHRMFLMMSLFLILFRHHVKNKSI
jgi:glycosyltransferase involved in cell wall biosynthesis